MLGERETIRAAAAAGHSLTHTIRDSRGRVYETRRRALSNASINKGLDAAKMVLRECRALGQLGDVPAFKQARLKSAPPSRSFLEPEPDRCPLLRAAAALEARAPRAEMGEGPLHPRLVRVRRRAGARARRVRHARSARCAAGSSGTANPVRATATTCPCRAPIVDTSARRPAGQRTVWPRRPACRSGRRATARAAQVTKTDAGERVLPSLRERLGERRARYPSSAGEAASSPPAPAGATRPTTSSSRSSRRPTARQRAVGRARAGRRSRI